MRIAPVPTDRAPDSPHAITVIIPTLNEALHRPCVAGGDRLGGPSSSSTAAARMHGGHRDGDPAPRSSSSTCTGHGPQKKRGRSTTRASTRVGALPRLRRARHGRGRADPDRGRAGGVRRLLHRPRIRLLGQRSPCGASGRLQPSPLPAPAAAAWRQRRRLPEHGDNVDGNSRRTIPSAPILHENLRG